VGAQHLCASSPQGITVLPADTGATLPGHRRPNFCEAILASPPFNSHHVPVTFQIQGVTHDSSL
jgi:hypothetical protein